MTDSQYKELLRDAQRAEELFSQDELEEYARDYWRNNDVG